MAFTVEDGSGLSAANSYASDTAGDAYFGDRSAPAAWSGATQTEKRQALVEATDYIDSPRRFPYRGTKKSATQRLQWPRKGASEFRGPAVADNIVPPAVADAAIIIAAIILAGDEVQPVLERGGAVKREELGPIKVEYSDNAPAEDVVTAALDRLYALTTLPGLFFPRMTVKQPATPDPFREGAFDHAGSSDLRNGSDT